MSPSERMLRMHEQLTAELQPSSLEISDDSHLHIGHAGARGGAGHYTVRIIAQTFTGKTLVERHRMIYNALSIQARSPDELQANQPTTT